jgi:hypothetical protein
MATATAKDTIDTHGDAPRGPELSAPLLGYRLVNNTTQGHAFAFAGAPVSLVSLTAPDISTSPPRVNAEVTVAGAWVFVLTAGGTQGVSDTPSLEKVTWTLPVDQIEAVYGLAAPQAPAPLARK